jgi:hypothetical protein
VIWVEICPRENRIYFKQETGRGTSHAKEISPPINSLYLLYRNQYNCHWDAANQDVMQRDA